MARTVRDSNLESRTARRRLDPSGQPYYRALEPGLLHLGYRKPRAGAGKWLARVYTGNGSYRLHKIGVADDNSDADSKVILSYRQAQARARKLLVEQAGGGAGTVGDAMDAYIRFLKDDGRPPAAIRDVVNRDRASIRPVLGSIKLAKLTTDHLQRWRDDLVKAPPRVRTGAGKPQQYRARSTDAESQRARRATAKRTWATLRAALAHAFRNGDVDTDIAWRRVVPLRNTDGVRARYLTTAQAARLINAADSEFRPILRAGFETGARWGQLAALVVSDYNPDAGTLRLRSRKGRGVEKVYYVPLSDAARDLFAQACAGRADTDLIFRRGGGAWERAQQQRRMEDASARAGIRPAVHFHCTRHTFASLSVMNGAPLLVVAKALGHADVRLVATTYGHLAPDFMADAIRKAAPRYGIKSGNVRPLR
ncbi:MAG TPA: tyrosine-type recombinase/integrase [Burkholderiaceae bacterium]|nr:tyrosine-type recombinase/integrase [Burkholderiaceae bacterium]